MHSAIPISDFTYRRLSSSAPALPEYHPSPNAGRMTQQEGGNPQETLPFKEDDCPKHGIFEFHQGCLVASTTGASHLSEHLAPLETLVATGTHNRDSFGGPTMYRKAPRPSLSLCQDMSCRKLCHHPTEVYAPPPTTQLDPDGRLSGVYQLHQNEDIRPATDVAHDQEEALGRISIATGSTIVHDRTISIRSGDSEDIHRVCAAVGGIHDICLSASKTFLISHHANLRARASVHSASPNDNSSNFVDAVLGMQNDLADARLQGYPSQPYSVQLPTIPPISNSLLKNISGICNMLWVGSQRDRLTVLNAERMAVNNMARLLSWAETVAMGDHDEWVPGKDDALKRVLDAGKNLCAWLSVQDTLREMRDLEEILISERMGMGQDHV